MKAHTPMTDALRVNASATFDSHEKTLHAMGKLEAINADLLAALEVAYEHINGGPGIKTGSAFIAMWEQTRNAIAKARGQA